MITPEEKYMKLALEAAAESSRNGDYAHGAVIVLDNVVVSVGHETLKSANDPVNGHAEIDAIRKACQKLQQPYLGDAVLYSTAEPCPMCISAVIWAKIPAVVYALTRDDMIAEMERLKVEGNGKFSWRQIAIPASYVVERGEPKVELYPDFMREEGLKMFALTGKQE
jgi:tRNA(Arg) A34 adenosine deaminase TadA